MTDTPKTDSPQTDSPKKVDHLHGVTLKAMIEHLVDRYGWDGLGDRIAIRSFTHDPSVNSSLKFLRKTPWAREKVESLYVHSASHPRKTKTVTNVEPDAEPDAEPEAEPETEPEPKTE